MMDPNTGELPPGQAIAGYKIRQLVGEGSAGRVHAAIRPISGDKVAIKIIHPFLVSDASVEELLARVRPLVGLSHENLVTLVDIGRTDEGLVYLISEFVQGTTLTDLLHESGPLSLAHGVSLLRQLASGLLTAHERGVAHGTLSPDNVWLSPRREGDWPPRLRVMDFGLDPLLDVDGRLPYYLAPEQCRGEPGGLASDAYALGVMACRMLTSRLPFSSARPAEVRRMHLEREPPLPDVDETLRRLLKRLLAKEAGARPSMGEVLDLLRSMESSSEMEPPVPMEPVDAEAPEAAQAEEEPEAPPAAEEPEAPGAEASVSEAIPDLPGVEVSEVGARQMLSMSTKGEIDAGARHPLVTTGVLPRVDMEWPRRSFFPPLVSAALAVVTAVVVGALTYRLLVGRWPLATESTTEPGQLSVRSDPHGATVYLNGVRQARKTPLTLTHLRQGQPYALYLHLPGHRAFRQRVALGIGEPRRTLSVVLVRRAIGFGTLKLGANIKADFFLDSRRVGTQTREVTLMDVQADADHQLRVSAPGHRPLTQTVRVETGKVQVLQFDLLPDGS